MPSQTSSKYLVRARLLRMLQQKYGKNVDFHIRVGLASSTWVIPDGQERLTLYEIALCENDFAWPGHNFSEISLAEKDSNENRRTRKLEGIIKRETVDDGLPSYRAAVETAREAPKGAPTTRSFNSDETKTLPTLELANTEFQQPHPSRFKHFPSFLKPKLRKRNNLAAADGNRMRKYREQETLILTIKHGDSQAFEQVLHMLSSSDLDQQVDGSTALEYAVESGRTDMVRTLLLNGANTHVVHELNGTLLHRAAGGGMVETMQLLLGNGIHINARDAQGRTALLMVCQKRPAKLHGVLECLLGRQDIDIEAEDENIATPLSKAAYCGDVQAVNMLLNAGARPNVADNDGNTPLHYAIWYDGTITEALLNSHGGSELPDMKTKKGRTALHLCADLAPVEALVNAKILEKHNATINIEDFSGKTPLDLATDKSATREHLNMIEFLIHSGACITSTIRNDPKRRNFKAIHDLMNSRTTGESIPNGPDYKAIQHVKQSRTIAIDPERQLFNPIGDKMVSNESDLAKGSKMEVEQIDEEEGNRVVQHIAEAKGESESGSDKGEMVQHSQNEPDNLAKQPSTATDASPFSVEATPVWFEKSTTCACSRIIQDTYVKYTKGNETESLAGSIGHERSNSHSYQSTASNFVQKCRASVGQRCKTILSLLVDLLPPVGRRRDNEEEPEHHLPPVFVSERRDPPNERYLFVCFTQWRRYLFTRLSPICMDISCDDELFQRLRHNYEVTNGPWRRALGFRRVTDIRFVKFQLTIHNLVEINVHSKMQDRMRETLPRTTDPDYQYRPRPVTVYPPVGHNLLMHLYECPDACKQKDFCISRFPKHSNGLLQVDEDTQETFAWGIELAEGLDWAYFWILGLIIIIAASVFGTVWVCKKGSIQDGFTIATYLITVFAFIAGSAQVAFDRG